MNGGKLNAACREVVRAAVVQLGCGAAEVWHMSPAELGLRIEAEKEARFRRAREADLVAWLTGQYAAVALNKPGSYPNQPDRVARKAQSEGDMKALLRRMAGRRGENETGGAGGGDVQSGSGGERRMR